MPRETRLSVNVNKIATLRNSRGGDYPNLIEAVKMCEAFGAQGITVHPRPDQRHIRYEDVEQLSKVVTTELNIEGYPSKEFIDLVKRVKPVQVTLVPDAADVITSNQGWDYEKHLYFLQDVCNELQMYMMRVSLFVDAEPERIMKATRTGCDCIELYTGPYAEAMKKGDKEAVKAYAQCADIISQQGLYINAGHDLNLENIKYFKENVKPLDEVSIGHALMTEALLYYGLEKTIHKYLEALRSE